MQRLTPSFSRVAVVRVLIGTAIMAALLVLGLPPRLSASSAQTTPSYTDTAFRVAIEAWTSQLSFNPYAAAGYEFNQYASLPLADVSGVESKKLPDGWFFPQLAKSWTLGKKAITIHIQPKAKWQNGAPITSADVEASLILAGEDYNQAWASIADVKTPSAKTVVIDLRPGTVPLNAWTNIAQIAMVPRSVYKQLIPAGAESWLVQYWNLYKDADPSVASINAANNSPGGKQIAKLAAEIPTFAPKKLIGDGPYTFSHASTDEILLKKWPGFWDAKKIHVPWLEIVGEATPGNTFGDLIGGRVDAESYSIFNDPDVLQLEHSPYGRYRKVVVGGNASVILLHEEDYPYNILNVRKALYYLINRPRLTHLESGGQLEQNQTIEVADGMTNPTTNLYLTKQQRDSLQAYNYSPAKATALLKASGFTKKDGSWYLPNGKPWKITLYTQTAQARMDADVLAISGMWKQAGIDANVDMVDAATFTQEELKGDYAVGDTFNYEGTVNPLQEIANTLVTDNYPIADAGSGTKCSTCQAAVGIGPIANVPGLGKVNIESALTRELATAPASQWRTYAWDWARFENEELPGLPVTSTDNHLLYSVNRYTDYPPASVQQTAGFNVTLWQQLGYLKLRPGA